MAKMLKMTPEYKAELEKEFREMLEAEDILSGKIQFEKKIEDDDRKAVVYFNSVAWVKMVMLIQEFSKEVAWHGVARRIESDKDEYVIDDILVYPQEVAGATVNTDQDKYETWLYSQEDDVFNNIRMQGHSHVDMGASPSTVDVAHQEKILEQLEDDMFYIFMIWNKSFKYDVRIYDRKKNRVFDNSCTSIKMLDGGVGLSEFIQSANKLVQEKTYVPAPATKAKGTGTTPATKGSDATQKPVSKIGAGWKGKSNTEYYNGYCYYDDYGNYTQRYYNDY